MASRFGAPEVDLSASTAKTTGTADRHDLLGPPPGQRELRVGLSPNSRGNSPPWESDSLPRACGRPCAVTASNHCRAALARPDQSSCRPKRRPSWPVTSSPSTRCCSNAFAYCSSSNSTPAGSTSPASPPSHRGNGSSSRHATSPRIFPSIPEQPSSSSGTETRSSLPVSTRCSAPRTSESARHPFDLHQRTHSPSDSSAPFAESAPIGSSSSGELISDRYWPSTPLTTMTTRPHRSLD